MASEWKNQVPNGYYCQILHSMYVGDFDFAVLFAILLNKENDAEIRASWFEREEVKADIAWLVENETTFWKHVERRTMPPTKITF